MASKPRIPLPGTKDPKGALDLGAAILKKHASDGASSPIRGELKADFDAVAPRITQALDWHNEALAMERKLEELYEKRDNVVAELVPLNQRISKSLQSEYGTTNLRRMGDHGFTADDSPRPPKPPKSAAGSKG